MGRFSLLLIGLLVVKSVFVIGGNFYTLWQTTPESQNMNSVKAKYDEAKKKQGEMENTILSYNLIANDKKIAVPIIDGIVSIKPEDIKLATITLNSSSKLLTIDAFADSRESATNFLQAIKTNSSFVNAEIPSIDQKEGKYQFKIKIPIGG